MPICASSTCKTALCLSTNNSSSYIVKGRHVSPNHITTSVRRQFAKIAELSKIRSPTLPLILNIQLFPRNITTRSPQHHPLQAPQTGGRSRKVVVLQALHQHQSGGDMEGSQGESTVGGLGLGHGGLVGRVVAFTTPLQYASRFENFLREVRAEPLWCPTIVTEQTEQTRQELEDYVRRSSSIGEFQVHGVAFTSRAGIKAISEVLNGRQLPLDAHDAQEGVDDSPFFVAALGKDAELLRELNVIAENSRVSIVVPEKSTPQALVEALGEGNGRKILCPVPSVEGLEEPPVVPQFLQDLRAHGWDPVRVNSYVTRWLGCDCAKPLLVMDHQKVQLGSFDGLVFTSTAEIEGLLKSFQCLGLDGVQALQRRSRKFLVACHGPVTALGAQRLGVEVDVVGKEFQSFDGVIKALSAEFRDAVQS
ncbi:unnamed protein product [Calypogeia fissa]